MGEGDKTRARAKAWAADLDAARRRAGLALPDAWAGTAQQLRDAFAKWLAAEVAPGRLILWLPVAFGCGLVIYFSAGREPAWWAAAALAIAAITIAVAARRRLFGFPIAVALAAMSAGFATGTLRTAYVEHPVLQAPVSAKLAGFVEVREERERTDRIVVRVHNFDGRKLAEQPERVRVAVRKGTAPAVGSFIEFQARLSSPLQPLRPGGYDFARDMYFHGIGASGFVLGSVKPATAPATPGFWLRYAAVIDDFRGGIDKRIRSIIEGDRGSIASALITGKRDAISQPVNDAMYVSSLAHVLSISGYHMALVAGIVFFTIRAGLALLPAFASRRPIKKYAALGALFAAAFYLLLSGAEVATQRSFVMVAIVLIGVMLDRPALTFRTLMVAALAVLLLTPEAVVHPSFQMSFAATLALVAAYQNGFLFRPDADTPLGARVALWGTREIAALILASVVAGLATTPYAAFHFHRLAPYGVVANLLAMPVVSVWVMPLGILGVLAMPFGLDAPLWRLMGEGIDWMITIAQWVTSLPGAVGRVHAFGVAPLLLGTAGLLLVCLLRTPLRWSGAALVVVAGLWAAMTPRADVLIAPDGRAVAARNAQGKLSIMRTGGDSFAVQNWLAADGDERKPGDKSLSDGVLCDPAGCIAQMADGRVASLALNVEAFEEDCARASVVVSASDAPADCAAFLADRKAWREYGAMALRWDADRLVVEVARPKGYDRPWARAVATPEEDAAMRTTRPAPRDATPRADDLEAGD